MRLLAHEDGSYEWVPPADYRVAEVRLLDSAGSVGMSATVAASASDSPTPTPRGASLRCLDPEGWLPLAWRSVTVREHESRYALPLLDAVRERGFHTADVRG